MSTELTPQPTSKRRALLATAAVLLFCCSSFLASAPHASAYGGGFPGFPPGWLHNGKKDCEWRVVDMPFGHRIKVIDCKKHKQKEKKEKKQKFEQRMDAFFERFKRGGR